MSALPLLECGLLGLALVFILIPAILKICQRGYLRPRLQDLHHTHETPVPRVGGLALVAAFVGIELFVVAMFPAHRAKVPGRSAIILSSLAMFIVGFWDDLRPLGAKRKLMLQILISVAVCCFGVGIQNFKIPFTQTIIELHGWGVLLTVAWLVFMTNLINLVDGVDGLAGGICLMLMALLTYVGQQNGSFVLLTSGMAGALLGFLWFNFPPARIYMGDGGAYFLGFQLGLFAIAGSQKGTLVAALVAPLFVLALPIVDVALAILRRGLRGLPLFRPDRRHIHHHLISMGHSRRKVVISIYAVTLVFLAMGFVAFWSRGHLVPVLLGLSALLLLLCAGKLSFSREWFAIGRVLGNSLAMRQEIQSGLCLTRWLALEGKRRNSVESLWPDLLFVARRLGFTSLKLTLADGARVWQEPDVAGPMHFCRQELRHCGILELQAPAPSPADPLKNRIASDDDESEPLYPLADEKLFAIMAELLAEGWVNATKSLAPGQSLGLKFSSKPSFSPNLIHRRSEHYFIPSSAPAAPADSIPKPLTGSSQTS